MPPDRGHSTKSQVSPRKASFANSPAYNETLTKQHNEANASDVHVAYVGNRFTHDLITRR